jgi:catechol 2,3-dioxygenase-like lactoylglutathione lyase family enzyme
MQLLGDGWSARWGMGGDCSGHPEAARAMTVLRLDHVQLAMPPGGEARAEAFYAGILGLERISKPPALAVRGGCWFQGGPAQIHLGVEEDFRPARKAHPALAVSDYDALCQRLTAAGHPVRPNDELPGIRRCHVDDPFGNRIELIEGDAP